MSDQYSDSPTLLSSLGHRWLVRSCALLATVLCGWLAWQKMTGVIGSLAGCGQADGCAQVLGGRWSQWMGLPVSFLAFGFYTAVFLLTLEPVQRWFSIQADRLLVAAALMAMFCAVWFIGILWWREKTFCPYCVAAHSMGLVFAILILHRAWQLRGRETHGFFTSALSVSVPAFLVLVLGQLYGPQPETHAIVTTSLPTASPDTPPRPAALPGNLAFFDGALSYPIAELPRIGAPAGQYQLVEYFDYTCASCRDMSGDFDALFKAYPNQFTITVLPCPLNRACNPYCGPKVKDHPGACELAHYALAVWRTVPADFAAYHAFLMHLPLPVDVPTAKAKAETLCGGADQLTTALAQPWIQQRLTLTTEEYRILSATDIVMPKLLLQGSTVMNGTAKDTATFLDLIKTKFKLTTPQGKR